MRLLFSVFIFLSSGSIWSEKLFIVCDTFHIFSPDYEKRIYFQASEEDQLNEKAFVWTYVERANGFFPAEWLIRVLPTKIRVGGYYTIDRKTGKMEPNNEADNLPTRTCESLDEKSYVDEILKGEEWSMNIEKDLKI